MSPSVDNLPSKPSPNQTFQKQEGQDEGEGRSHKEQLSHPTAPIPVLFLFAVLGALITLCHHWLWSSFSRKTGFYEWSDRHESGSGSNLRRTFLYT
jgi:hypothetical protein